MTSLCNRTYHCAERLLDTGDRALRDGQDLSWLDPVGIGADDR